MTFVSFACGPETYLGQHKDTFPLSTYLPALNATNIKKIWFQCLQSQWFTPSTLQGLLVQEVGIQQLQYFQAMQACVSGCSWESNAKFPQSITDHISEISRIIKLI